MVDIFFLTYNRLAYLKTTIKFLYLSTKVPFRLFIIDNGSTDGSREYILELEKQGKVYKHLFNEENQPLAKAYTSCFEKFRNELNEFIITAPDDIIPPITLKHDWLEIFIKKMESDKNVGLINLVGARCNYNSFIRKYDTKSSCPSCSRCGACVS